jgi:hypothetical protein
MGHRRNTGRLFVPTAVAVAAFAFPSYAQTARFLTPDSFDSKVGSIVRLTLVQESGPEQGGIVPAPWPNAIDRFFIRVAGIQDNRTTLPAEAVGDGPAVAVLPLTEPGVTMVVLDWKPELIEVDPASFRAFLSSRVNGAAAERVPDGRPVRVRHVASAKALLRVAAKGPQPPDAATATSKSGQAVEIRAVFDPTVTPVGADLPVRVYIRGDSESGALVRVEHVAGGHSARFITNAKGMGDFRVTADGPWRMAFQTARKLTEDPDADWEVCSGTLTFSSPGAEKAGGR